MFGPCYVIPSSFATILIEKGESRLHFINCLSDVLCLLVFFDFSLWWVSMQCVIIGTSDHTRLPF